MLNLFRGYNPYSVIILLLVAVFLKLPILIHPEMALVHQESSFAWIAVAGFVERMCGGSSFLVTFFAVMNIVGQSIFLNRIANKHHLFPGSSYFPALAYVMISSLFREWNYFSAPMACNWLLLAVLGTTLQLYTSVDARKQLFNIGCYIGLASMLVFADIGFVLMLVIALAILRPFKAAEWLVGLLGVVTPFYFLVGILFLTDRLPQLRHMFSFGFSFPKPMIQGAPMIAAISMIVLLVLIGFFNLTTLMSRMLIQYKKWWSVILVGLFISLSTAIFSVAIGYNQWMVLLIPVTLVAANGWVAEYRKWMTTVMFYLFLAVIIFVQWAP